MADIKISELEPTTDLEGLYTIGSDKNNLSKKVSLQFLKDAANYANEQGDYAKQAGDTVNGNVGVSDYPEFSASKSYVIGDIVRYNGVLYAFTANHAASAWNGSDVKATSINAITSGKLTELESEKVSVPNFSVTENNVLNQRIKELYLFNIDSSKYYYIYNCIFNPQYETYQFYVCRSNNKEEAGVSPLEIVALYDNRIKPDGIVPLTMNDEIVGYALLDIKEADGMDMGRKELVTLDVVSNLDYNPAIKQYLSTFEIEKKLTKFAVNAQYSLSSNNIANSRFKEIYLKGIKDNTIYYLFNGGYSLSSDTYQIYICKADSEENIGVDVVKNIVGAYDRKEKPVGIVPLTTNGLESGEIVGYFVAEINQEDETSDVRYALLNNTIVSNLDYNPAIRNYINLPKEELYKDSISINETTPINVKTSEYPTMNIALSDAMLYIRTSYDESRDIMLSYSLENANNVFAAAHVWIGDNNLSDSQLRSNANLFHDAFDSNPPLPTINFGYLGGNHGLYTLKVYATGKTKDDIGSIYTASAYGDFKLVDIDSANGIMWLAPVILQDDSRPYPYRKWSVNNPVGNTFTYKSGGVTTTNIVATSVDYGNSAQYVGTAKKTRIVFELDGKVIGVGNHEGKHFVVYEEYNIIDAAKIYQYHDMIAESLAKYRLTYEFCGASCIIHTDLEAVKDIYLNYYAPIQPVGIQDRNGNTAYFMMPKTSYKTLTDVDNVASRLYYRNDSDLIDVNRLPERAMWAYKDASGKLISAYAAGSSLLHGDGMNEIRTKNVLLGDAIHSLAKPAGWCKWYPRQNSNGRIKAGNHVNWTAYITYFAPSDDVITWSNYEADVKVTYIHCMKDVNMTIDMKDCSQIQILELSGVDYILEDKILTIMGNSGDYIVISCVA